MQLGLETYRCVALATNPLTDSLMSKANSNQKVRCYTPWTYSDGQLRREQRSENMSGAQLSRDHIGSYYILIQVFDHDRDAFDGVQQLHGFSME